MLKIGFACIVLDNNKNKLFEEKSTTRKYFELEKTEKIIFHNLQMLKEKIKWLSTKPEIYRMMRISSNILPLKTAPETKELYTALRNDIEQELSAIGKIAIQHDIRLSAHPDQFVIINNHIKKDLFDNSVKDLIVHADFFEMMGYSNWQDVQINIHCGGREGGTTGFKKGFDMLPSHVKKYLTVENCEFCYSVEDLFDLKEYLPIVFDIHHHEIKTNNLLKYDDKIFDLVKESWRGKRPKIHYSVEPYELRNEKGSKRRPHADLPWCDLRNNVVLEYLEWTDIMVELKAKTIAAGVLIEKYIEKSNKIS
jgi:UV DNA damage repair endonuclease